MRLRMLTNAFAKITISVLAMASTLRMTSLLLRRFQAVLKAANEKNISNPDEVGVGVDVWLSDIAMELMDEHSSHSHELPYE